MELNRHSLDKEDYAALCASTIYNIKIQGKFWKGTETEKGRRKK